MAEAPVTITLYRWAGSWGPFRVKIRCGECTLTDNIIHAALSDELKAFPVEFVMHDWLDVWWRPLLHGGWHAPIVSVNDKVISQGVALNRGVLVEAVVNAYAKSNQPAGNLIFGKAGCPHCQRAKDYLNARDIPFTYHDVVDSTAALYLMLAWAKPLIPARTPITVPQIWLDGKYIGGADNLQQHLGISD